MNIMKPINRFRFLSSIASLGFLLLCADLYEAAAQPIGKYPDSEGTITNITLGTAAQRQAGSLAEISLKASRGTVAQFQFSTQTKLQIQKGKMVERGTIADLKVGDRISVWFKEPVDPSHPAPEKADTVIVFRPGEGGVPLPPRGP
jgi:hypothetical protein